MPNTDNRGTGRAARRGRALIAGVITFGLLAALEPGVGVAAAASTQAGVELRDRACSFEPEIAGAECHTLVVPVDRAKPKGETYELPVVVLKATGANPSGDAIVEPAGGPGYSGLENVQFFSDSWLREQHDIVLYEQRGMGDSQPSLNCPEREQAFVANLAVAEPIKRETDRYAKAMRDCRRRLEREGVDLSKLDTPTSAADLKALRQALGYPQWNLLGVSYGARLALEMLRVDPKGTRAAIIDSAYVPGNGGLARSLELARGSRARLVAACNDDAGCKAKHPDLAGEIDALVAKADAQPIETSVTLEDGTVVPLKITGSDIAGALFNAQYDETLIPLLPGIVTSLSQGDTSIVPEIGRRAIPFVNSVAEGAAASVDCADNGSLDTRKADARALAKAGNDALVVALNPDCSQWKVPPVRDSFARLPHSRVPMLALAGSLDPITPPTDTKAAADAARGPSTFVEFEGNGHGNWNSNDCAQSIVKAFLADPASDPDTSCAAGLTFSFSS